MDAPSLTRRLKEKAHRLGFAAAGATPAVTPTGLSRFHDWLAAGYHGEMDYLPRRRDAYEHPRHVMPGVRSLLMLALPYRTADPADTAPGQGRISRYAWGDADYHDLIHDRLRELAAYLTELVPAAKSRGVVDSAPLLEREFAQLAGLGWIGKHSLLLSRELGSWFFLAALLTDVELAYDDPTATDHCGSCTACLDACPTDAFVAPYVLDARKCLSYTTIELRGLPDESLRAQQGDWLFGCDICQEVCPWNNRSPSSLDPSFAPRDDHQPVDLAALFDLDDEAFRARYRHTPLWRAKRRGLLRNAAFALAANPSARATQALQRGQSDPDPLICEACAWALNQLATNQPLRR